MIYVTSGNLKFPKLAESRCLTSLGGRKPLDHHLRDWVTRSLDRRYGETLKRWKLEIMEGTSSQTIFFGGTLWLFNIAMEKGWKRPIYNW